MDYLLENLEYTKHTFWHTLCLEEPDVHAKYNYFFFTFVFNVKSYDIYNVHSS